MAIFYSHDHFRMTLHSCWAEEKEGQERFEFWNQFCPQYSFVAPQVVTDMNVWLNEPITGNEYLNYVAWDRRTPIHSLNFRWLLQFTLIY